MVDALVSGASAARRAGSSPVLGTLNKSQLKQNQLVGSFLFKNCTEFAPTKLKNIKDQDKNNYRAHFYRQSRIFPLKLWIKS